MSQASRPNVGTLGSRKRGWWAAVAVCGALLGLCSSAGAAVYYVSPSGDDASAGTFNTPWRTIAKAGRTAVAGDTVMIMAGVYHETLVPANSGSIDGGGITFTAVPGQEVVLDGGTGRLTDWTLESGTPGVDAVYSKVYTGPVFGLFQDDVTTAGRAVVLWDMGTFNEYDSNPNFDLHLFDPSHDLYGWDKLPKHDGFSQYKYADGVLRVRTWDARSPDDHNVRGAAMRAGLVLQDRHYITVHGLKFRHFRNFALIDSSTHILIDECDFRFSGWTGIWMTGADGSQIRRSVIQAAGSWIGHYEDGINIKKSNMVTLEGNDVSYAGHIDVVIQGGDQLLLHGNLLHDSGGHLLTMRYGVTNAIVDGNTFIRAATTAATSVHRTPHAAIQFNGGSYCVFRRNLIYAGGLGILISADPGSSTSWNRFQNNTIQGSESDGIQLLAYPAVTVAQLTGNDFVNNIVTGSGEYEIHLDIPAGDVSSFFFNSFRSNLIDGSHPLRLWTLNRTVLGGEFFFPEVFSRNLAADPAFVDPAAGRFELRPGSPAIDAGLDIGLPYLGAAPDLGAIELQ